MPVQEKKNWPEQFFGPFQKIFHVELASPCMLSLIGGGTQHGQKKLEMAKKWSWLNFNMLSTPAPTNKHGLAKLNMGKKI